jgi:hypothetical protein
MPEWLHTYFQKEIRIRFSVMQYRNCVCKLFFNGANVAIVF